MINPQESTLSGVFVSKLCDIPYYDSTSQETRNAPVKVVYVHTRDQVRGVIRGRQTVGLLDGCKSARLDMRTLDARIE